MASTQSGISAKTAALLRQASADLDAGRFNRAEQLCGQALQLEPSNSQALFLMGVVAFGCHQLERSAKLLAQAIALRPDVPEFHSHLGLAFAWLAQFDAAIGAFDEAIRLAPADMQIRANKANVMLNAGRVDEARQILNDILQAAPDFAQVRYNLANLLKEQGKLEESIGHYERAVRDKPNLAEHRNNLATALEAQGRSAEAVAQYREALRCNPKHAGAHSNLLLALHYVVDTTGDEVFQQAAFWNEQLAATSPRDDRPYQNSPEPNRPLRVAYLGAALREHPQGFVVEPVLRNHDADQFKVFLYADMKDPDALSERLKGLSREWREIADLDNAEVARLLREDQIDILVDLTWHCGRSRLLMFARQPAPIQVSWGDGPVATTGLAAMDYLIADRHHCPPGARRRCVEEIYRMPSGYICFQPPSAAPEPGDPPVTGNGYVTFGSFNKLPKFSPQTIQLWSQVLTRVPKSRLVLKDTYLNDPPTRNRLLRNFEKHGVDPARIDTQAASPRAELLQAYLGVDVALDTVPYSGGFTTLESLWMGVPVVTLRGAYAAANHSVCHLTNAGLAQLIAESSAEFVNMAAELSGDVARLRRLRTRLRSQLAGSPICDEAAFTRDLEHAYRGMWRSWCNDAAAR